MNTALCSNDAFTQMATCFPKEMQTSRIPIKVNALRIHVAKSLKPHLSTKSATSLMYNSVRKMAESNNSLQCDTNGTKGAAAKDLPSFEFAKKSL